MRGPRLKYQFRRDPRPWFLPPHLHSHTPVQLPFRHLALHSCRLGLRLYSMTRVNGSSSPVSTDLPTLFVKLSQRIPFTPGKRDSNFLLSIAVTQSSDIEPEKYRILFMFLLSYLLLLVTCYGEHVIRVIECRLQFSTEIFQHSSDQCLLA